MINPSTLSKGQRIELKQNQKGQWQEWLFDKDNNILFVENVNLSASDKKIKSSNYDELKKNYIYLSKKENEPLKLDKWGLEIPESLDDLPEDDNIIEDEPEIEEVRECGGDGELGDPDPNKDLEKEEGKDIKERENHDNEEEC